jgi:hypothetical protein
MFADYGAIQKNIKAPLKKVVKQKFEPSRGIVRAMPALRPKVNNKKLAAVKQANQARAVANKKAAADKAETNRQNIIAALAKQREFKLAQMQKMTDRKVQLAQEATNRLKLKQDAADKKRDDIIALKNAGNATAVKTAIDEYNKQLIDIQKANAEVAAANNTAQQAQQTVDSAVQATQQSAQATQQLAQSSGGSDTPETYTPQRAEEEYTDNEEAYYAEQDNYSQAPQNEEQYVPNEEGFNVEASQYETSEIPDEEVTNDVNKMSNALNETPNYNMYSEQYDYADDNGMSGFMDDVKILYNTKIKAPAGDYLRAKASEVIGQPKTQAVEETKTPTGTIIAGVIAASGLVYMLLKKKRR